MRSDNTVGDLAGLSDIPYVRCSRADTFGDTGAHALGIKRLTMVEVKMTAAGEFPDYDPFNRKPVS